MKRAVALLATATVALHTANAGDPPQKVSAPVSGGTFSFSNSPTYTPVAPGSSEPENPKLKALENLKGASSLDAIFHLPDDSLPEPAFQQPQIAPRRNSPGFDRRKNWAFADLEDPLLPRAGDQQFSPRNTDMFGRDDSQLSLAELYFQNSTKKAFDPAKDGKDPNKQPGNKVRNETTGFDPLASALKNSDPFFRKMVTGDDEPGIKPVSAKEITGGSGPFAMTPEERDQMRRLAAFRHQLDPSYPLPKADNQLSFIDFGTQAQGPAPTVLTPSAIFSQSITPGAGPVDPNLKAFHSHVYDDPTATALGLPQKSPFQLDKAAPAPPTAQSILSKIDPFDANAPKRKF